MLGPLGSYGGFLLFLSRPPVSAGCPQCFPLGAPSRSGEQEPWAAQGTHTGETPRSGVGPPRLSPRTLGCRAGGSWDHSYGLGPPGTRLPAALPAVATGAGPSGPCQRGGPPLRSTHWKEGVSGPQWEGILQ